MRHKHVVMISMVMITIILYMTFNQFNQLDNYENVEFLIGMSHPNLTDDWQIIVHEEMEERTKDLKNIKMIYSNAGSSSYKQIRDIQKLMDYGIDLLIVTINEANVLGPIIDDIVKEIPVIVLDKDIGSYDYTIFIGSDYYNIGKQAAKRIEEIGGNRDLRIVTMNGPVEEPTVAEMNKGFVDALSDRSNIEVVESVYCNWLRTEAENEFKAIVEKDVKFDIVFAQNNILALGIRNVLTEYNMDIPIVTVSKFMNENSMTNIEIGDIDTILYTPVGGKEAIDYALEILEMNEENPRIPKRIIMKSFPVTRENKEVYTDRNRREEVLNIGYIETDLFDESDLKNYLESTLEYKGQLDEEINVNIQYYDIDAGLSGNKKDQLQKAYFTELLDQEMDIIFLKVENNIGWENLIIEASLKDIYVICLGNMMNFENDHIIYIGPDYTDQGNKLAGYLINDIYGRYYDIGILEITGNPNAGLSVEKSKSIRSQISGYSRINIIDSIEGYFGSSSERDINEISQLSQNIVESLMKYPNYINVIYLQDDKYIESVKQAIEEVGSEDMVIISNNDTGVKRNYDDIDYIVYPWMLYKDQVSMLIENFIKYRDIYIDKIYLPNNLK